MAATTDNCQWLQDSVNWCEGRAEYAGIRRRIYFTAKTNIVKYPTLKLDALGRPLEGTLDGDFTLKEGTFFYFVDIVPERSQVTSDSQGEGYSQTSLDKATFVHPGVGPKAKMLAAYCHNSDNIYVFEDIDGRANVLGCEEFRVKSQVSMDYGQGPTGQPGTTITIEATNKVPTPRYTGKLNTQEGEIQCKKDAV